MEVNEKNAAGAQAPEQANAAPPKRVTLEISMAKIFDKKAKYKNSRKPIIICEQYRDFISLLSELNDCDISQVINNILSNYFGNERVTNQLRTFAKEKYKERMKRFDF
ncbi:MAG: hypothetical protein LBT70_04765 [Holosporaceae bacterium]|jgi:hypothetical protein|nr:hypothetical protein [Holosporaceae bacterium]